MGIQKNETISTIMQEWNTWMWFFVFLNFVDVLLTTFAVIGLGLQELNPVMRFFTSQGIVVFVIAKTIFVGFIMWSSHRAALQGRLLTLRIATFLYTGVIGWNIWALR